MSEEPERDKPEVTDSFREICELVGCSPMQTLFAACLLEGDNFTQAAFRAGYSGARDSVQLRTSGSQAARSKPVQAALALAESRGLGIPTAPGDRDELKRLLWKCARSSDKNVSIKASTELMKLEEQEKALEQPLPEPIEALKMIAEESHPLLALMVAELEGVKSQHGFRLTPEQQHQADVWRQRIATEYLNQVRAEAIASGKNVIELATNKPTTQEGNI
jgi:hypothetical protein